MRSWFTKLVGIGVIALCLPFTPLDGVPIQQRTAIAQSTPTDKLADANRLLEESTQYFLESQFQKAIQSLSQALAIYRDPTVQTNFPLESLQGEARTVGGLGQANFNLSQYQKAIDYFSEQLDITRESSLCQQSRAFIGEVNAPVSDWNQTFIPGMSLLELLDLNESELAQTVEEFERQFEYSFDYSFDYYVICAEGESSALNSMGRAYFALGAYPQAIAHAEESLSIAQAQFNRVAEGVAQETLGDIYFELKEFSQAIRHYQDRFVVSFGYGDPLSGGRIQSRFGRSYHQEGEYQSAVDFLEQGLTIALELDDFSGQGMALTWLGDVYTDLQQYSQATKSYEKALTILRKTGNLEGQGLVLSNIGALLAVQGNDDLAIVFYKQAVNVREGIRTSIQSLPQSLQKSYTESISQSYRRLAELLLKKGRIPEAQRVLDLLIIEELREFTQDTRASWQGGILQYSAVEQPIVDTYGSLMALGQKIFECEAISCSNLQSLQQQQTRLVSEYDKTVADFEGVVANNTRVDVQFYAPYSFDDSAYDLLQANPDSVLIYPFVTEEKLWILWTSAGGAVGSIDIPVSQTELSQTIQQLGAQLNNLSAPQEIQKNSQKLYSWLIAPLEAQLQDNNIRQLIFVNDKVTRYVPMAVLHDGDQYLIENYAVSTVITPDLTDTESTLASVSQSQALGLGLTKAVPGFNQLPAVTQELDGIIRSSVQDPVGIYPGQVLLDDDFTLEALNANIHLRQILHIATHAEFSPTRPEDSYIVLGNGQRMNINDIRALGQNLQDLHMVVLSACKTALGGTAGDGTEIAGISSYFLGTDRAKTVIASLWAVNDSSTSLLMQRFYEMLATGALTKAEALQQAQLSLLYDQDTETRLAASRATIGIESNGRNISDTATLAHPYYWAPFILIGNGL